MRLNPMQCAGWLTSLTGIKHHYCDVLKAVSRIILERNSQAEWKEAVHLRVTIQSFDFVLLAFVLGKVLSAVNAASTYLQSKDANKLTVSQYQKTAFDELLSYRNNFGDAITEAKRTCNVWGVEPVFKDKRARKTKRHVVDELCHYSRLINPEGH